jgi:HSP20 family protein
MTVRPDSKPKIKEFGNVKSPFNIGTRADFFTKPLISSERQPLADVTTTDNEYFLPQKKENIMK